MIFYLCQAITALFVIGWFLLTPVPLYVIMELLIFCLGGFNLLTDILLIILPFPILRGLRLKWQK